MGDGLLGPKSIIVVYMDPLGIALYPGSRTPRMHLGGCFRFMVECRSRYNRDIAHHSKSAVAYES